MKRICNISLPTRISADQSPAGKEVYRFCVSDERINRNGWKTLTAGIDLLAFQANPIVLYGHRGVPIGLAIAVFKEQDKLYADLWFHEENDESKLVKKLVDLQVLRMTSIGLNLVKMGTPIPIPPEEKDKYPPWMDVIDVLAQTELREISVVPIPANDGAMFIEKLKDASVSGNITASDYQFLNDNINLIFDNQVSQYSTINSEDFSMTTEEAVKEIGRLETLNAGLSKDKQTLATQLEGLSQDKTRLESQVNTLNTQLADAVKDRDAYKSDLDKARQINTENQGKIVEAQVAAKLASLSDRLLPVETADGKLAKELTHLKMNEATFKNSEGVSLYDVKIAELEARKPHNLTQSLNPAAAATTGGVTDFNTLDYNNPEHRQVFAAEATKRAKANNTNFSTELHKLLGGE